MQRPAALMGLNMREAKDILIQGCTNRKPIPEDKEMRPKRRGRSSERLCKQGRQRGGGWGATGEQTGTSREVW